jgi:hypothetical protein
VGVPARIVRIRGVDKEDLVPEKEDPYKKELCALRERIFALEEEITALTGKKFEEKDDDEIACPPQKERANKNDSEEK